MADVEIRACEFFGCTGVMVDEEVHLCDDLNFEDAWGYDMCGPAALYTFEASYTLPNHTWWEDLAIHGFSFQIEVTFRDINGGSLVCHGQFVTNVWYSTGTWVTMAVGSMMVASAIGYYYRQKMPRGVIDLCAAENMVDDTTTTTTTTKATDLSSVEIMEQSRRRDKKNQTNQKQETDARLCDLNDDESVTSTSYLRMLDFSPEGLHHSDRMEQVRQAHFERLRRTRESRRARLREEGDTF